MNRKLMNYHLIQITDLNMVFFILNSALLVRDSQISDIISSTEDLFY
jgi:hypothetical protein